MRNVVSRLALFLVVVGAVTVGCARVDVAPADLDRHERPGVPFYLQRPYFALKREMPVAGDAGYVGGRIATGGMVELINPPQELLEFLGGTPIVPLASVGLEDGLQRARDDLKPATVGGSLAPSAKGGQNGNGNTDEERTTGQESEKSGSGALTTATGDVSWDSTVPQSLPISEIFDIVYLPDLDEKYVISAEAGLGQAELGAAMGPGGTLNKFAMSVDNREMGKLVADTINKFTDVAVKAIDPKSAVIGTGTSAAEDAGFKPGDVVSLRYAYVIYATPGLYPILKTEEFRDGQGASSGVNSRRSADDGFYVLEARYPHTRISFNVRRVLTLSTKKPNAPQPVIPGLIPTNAKKAWGTLDDAVGPYLDPDNLSEPELINDLKTETDYDGVKAELTSHKRESSKSRYVITMKVTDGDAGESSKVKLGAGKKAVNFLLGQDDVSAAAKEILTKELQGQTFIVVQLER